MSPDQAVPSFAEAAASVFSIPAEWLVATAWLPLVDRQWKGLVALGSAVAFGVVITLVGLRLWSTPADLEAHEIASDSIHTELRERIDLVERVHRREDNEIVARLDDLVCELQRERLGEWPAGCAIERVLP